MESTVTRQASYDLGGASLKLPVCSRPISDIRASGTLIGYFQQFARAKGHSLPPIEAAVVD